jgi:hypothetical protein
VTHGRARLVGAFAAAAMLAASACGGDDDGSVKLPDAAFVQDDGVPEADAPPGTPDAAAPADAHAGCNARDLDPAWLEGYEQEVLGKIAGETEIATGLKITDRASGPNKAAVRTYLQAELTALGYAPQTQSFENGGVNVYARLGTGGRPVVIMGAHYDGIAPVGGMPVRAAADDGTGTALVLAAARWFKGVDCLDTDVVFVFFDQEEIGLVGSNYFAQKLVDDHESVVAVHSFDMISFDGDGDKALELWEPSPALQTLYQSVAPMLGSKVVLAPHFASSDHKSFLDDGFVATGVGEEFVNGDHTPHYHTPQDTYDKVSFDYLRLISRVAFAVVSTQAAPDAP